MKILQDCLFVNCFEMRACKVKFIFLALDSPFLASRLRPSALRVRATLTLLMRETFQYEVKLVVNYAL